MDYKGFKIGELRKMVKDAQVKPKTMKRAELVGLLSASSAKALEPHPHEEPVEMPKVLKSAVVEEKSPKKASKKSVKIEEPKKEEPKKKDEPKKSTHGEKVKAYMMKHKGVSLAEASKAVSGKK